VTAETERHCVGRKDFDGRFGLLALADITVKSSRPCSIMRDCAVWRSVWTVTSPVVIFARSSARSNTLRIVVYGLSVLAFVKTQA
jgi:hypothetical protein